MGINITTVDESLKDSGLKILVHGPAGSGKTTMCATTGAKTLIVSAESGLLSLRGAPDYIHVVEVGNIEQLGEVYELLNTKDHGYEWVALDSASELGEVCLSAEKKANKDARAAYGIMIDQMTTMLKAFRDLPINVIITCKQQRIEDSDTGHTVYAPQLPGNRLANDLPYLFDEVFALRVEKDAEGDDYRVLQTGTDIKYIAKDRSGVLDIFEAPNLKALLDKIHPNGTAKVPEKAPETDPVVSKEAEKELEAAIVEETKDATKQDEVLEKDTYFFHGDSGNSFMLSAGDVLEAEVKESCAEITQEAWEAIKDEEAVEAIEKAAADAAAE